MTREEFILELQKININLTEEQLDKLDKFYQLLINWNEKINLTTITKEDDVYLKHFYDSLTLIKVIDLRENLKILDVGSGAGFPGIVLKIVFPNLKITLLDSLNKRINYLNEIIKELELKDIETVGARCEEYTKIHHEEYDLIVSRAVAHLKILLEITFQSIKVKGFLIAMKSNAFDEIKESEDIINKLNGKIIQVEEFNLPKEDSLRTLIKIEKLGTTNNKYPRKYSEIKKSLKK
ncbi:MAG: 16S rRNA (guanine(527)-N(7))-methyltransferase RsmG [Bacilli bacterium]|nr:16S rRNA (guanine(527)-N(7))-methyltransferase RsmG [Bacilli bacterium]